MKNLELEKMLYDPTVSKIVVYILTILIIIGVSKFIKNYFRKKVASVSSRYQSQKIVSFASYLLIIIASVIIFTDKLGEVSVAFGVAGAGIAFALQEVIASFAGWFAITFNNFYRVGDRVKLGGIRGDVIDIGLLRTTMMEIGDWVDGDLYNGRTVRVLNSFIFKEPVFNYSGEYPFLWDEISIVVRSESDIAMTDKILNDSAAEVVEQYEIDSKEEWEKLVRKFMIEDARIDHMVTCLIDPSGIKFTLRYITNFKLRRITKDLLSRGILNKINDSNGAVELAVSTIELSTRPALELKMMNKTLS